MHLKRGKVFPRFFCVFDRTKHVILSRVSFPKRPRLKGSDYFGEKVEAIKSLIICLK